MKYGEPERVAYNMRMDQIYDGANNSELLIIRSNSSSADSVEAISPILFTATSDLVLVKSQKQELQEVMTLDSDDEEEFFDALQSDDVME